MHKKIRPYVKAAKAHGARVVEGTKHLKVYDGDELVATLHRGGKAGYEGRGDMRLIRKIWQQRGWL